MPEYAKVCQSMQNYASTTTGDVTVDSLSRKRERYLPLGRQHRETKPKYASTSIGDVTVDRLLVNEKGYLPLDRRHRESMPKYAIVCHRVCQSMPSSMPKYASSVLSREVFRKNVFMFTYVHSLSSLHPGSCRTFPSTLMIFFIYQIDSGF